MTKEKSRFTTGIIFTIFLVAIFLVIYNNKNNSVSDSTNAQPLNLQYPNSSNSQNPQRSQNLNTDAWTLDFPSEAGITKRIIIPSFSSLLACRTEGNKLSPSDYFCSRNCKSVNIGTDAGQELCDVSCTSARCNYIDTGKPYIE